MSQPSPPRRQSAEKHHAANDRIRIAIVQRSAGGVGESRVGSAVDLALVVGRDGQGRFGHGQRAVDVGDRVVCRRAPVAAIGYVPAVAATCPVVRVDSVTPLITE